MFTGSGVYCVNAEIPKAVSERCAIAVGAALKHPYQWQTGPTAGQRSTRSRPQRSVDMISQTPFLWPLDRDHPNPCFWVRAKSRVWGSLESS